MAILISDSASAATMGYGCKNSIQPLVLSFCALRGSCVVLGLHFEQNILYLVKNTNYEAS
jgi:hypothetical protein